MKIAGILLSSLIIMAILPGIGYSLAESAISITTNQSIYEYGDNLVMVINVSEITGDDVSIYIIDPTERRSLLLQQPISQKYTEFPSKFPFDATIWKPGTYVLELEYSKDSTWMNKSSTQFIIEDTGKIALPFWIKDLAHMWITEPLVTDKDFARALEYLIEHGIIKIPYTEPEEETVSSIPEWVKNNAEWWIEGKISDTEFTMALQYLIKTGIITVNLSQA